MIKTLVLTTLFVTSSLLAQIEGIWKNYSNMNDIVEMDISNDKIWAGTTGGVFSYDLNENSYRLYTKSEGLSSQNITSLKIHPNGSIWVGTLEGYIDIIHPESGDIDHINDIAKTDETSKRIYDFLIRGDSVYVGTDFGISLLDASRLLFIETYRKLGTLTSNSSVFSLFFDNSLIAITDKGIAELIPGSINPASPDSWNTISISGTASLFENSSLTEFNGKFYVGTSRGVYEKSVNTILPRFLTDRTIYDLAVSDNKLLIISADTVFSYDGSSINVEHSYIDVILNGMYQSTAGEKYIFSKRGIKSYPSVAGETFISPDGPALNAFSDMIVDNEGNLWAGSGRESNIGGIYTYNGNSWSNYNNDNTAAIVYDGFHRLYYGNDNTIYFSNWGKGFTTYKDGNFTSYFPPNIPVKGIIKNPNFLVVWNVAHDSKGNLWILNYEASDRNVLSLITPDSTWHHYEMASPLSSAVINCEHFAIDQYDTKWFANSSTFGNGPGLYYFNENGTLDDLDDDVWGVIKETDGLSNNTITDIEIDQRGEIWVGTTEGITVVIEPTKPTSRLQKVFPLRAQSITCIAVDPINRKWVGTNQGVFVVSSDGTELIANYTESNSPIPTNSIKSITLDKNSGMAYIGTDFGLSTVTTLSVKPVTSADELEIFPNPFIVGKHDYIYIDKLVKESSIKVLSIDGRLINELETPGGGIAKWDGKNSSGETVSSGVYIIVAYDREADNVQLGKIAVIKE